MIPVNHWATLTSGLFHFMCLEQRPCQTIIPFGNIPLPWEHSHQKYLRFFIVVKSLFVLLVNISNSTHEKNCPRCIPGNTSTFCF